MSFWRWRHKAVHQKNFWSQSALKIECPGAKLLRHSKSLKPKYFGNFFRYAILVCTSRCSDGEVKLPSSVTVFEPEHSWTHISFKVLVVFETALSSFTLPACSKMLKSGFKWCVHVSIPKLLLLKKWLIGALFCFWILPTFNLLKNENVYNIRSR